MKTSVAKTLTVACALSLWAFATASAGPLEDGNALYQKGDYAGAIRAYETGIAASGPSAGAYLNLATAQIKEGQRANAALNLRRAIMLDPALTDARVALSDVERSQGVPPVKASWQDRVAEKVPLSLVVGLGSVLMWVGMFAILFLIVRGRGNFGVLATCLLLLIIGAAVLGAGVLADPRLSQGQSGVVISEKGTKLLSAPADQSAAVATLPPSACVQVIRRSGDWTYCEAATGEKGWLPSSTVERVVPTT